VNNGDDDGGGGGGGGGGKDDDKVDGAAAAAAITARKLLGELDTLIPLVSQRFFCFVRSLFILCSPPYQCFILHLFTHDECLH
jgi:hypothetical protein